MKKVSIIVPVYNMEKSINRSVESLLNQSYKNYEVILVDDGSNDTTLDRCITIADINEKVRVIHTDNQGSGPARNTGIKHATGDYAYFPDADDFLCSHSIELLVKHMETKNTHLIVFGFKDVSSDDKVLGVKKYNNKIFSGEFIRQNFEQFLSVNEPYWIQGAPWNKFFDLTIIKENNIEFPGLRRHQDEVFISRYVGKVDQVKFIEDVLYSYYTNDVKSEWDKYPKDYLDIALKLKSFRIDILGKWNKNNRVVFDLIDQEFIFNYIKGLELTFAKKMNLSHWSRMKYIKNRIEMDKFHTINMPENAQMNYQKFLLDLIHNGRMVSLYCLLNLKVFLQKDLFVVFTFVKRLVKKL